MHPIPDKRAAAMCASALRDLVLVVWEDEIETAAVDIEGLAQMRLAHRRALDMPARPAASPGTVPSRQFRVGRLPQHKIGRVALIRRDFDPGAGDHLIAAAPREPPI